ncbi:Histone transcription regulator 3 homolog [Aspergillus nidulans FGSC A4] [Rhizoctonia solani]|uniref:Histone transcription regulator 3 homolog [Aspergillus nidulans FGSC A4] n=1 Tax=Rhizoctonia solani TaxID=456999 RepID=A0A0K6GJ46_9AGAM|nr:Histone transcription regulator 3 homolog [Aspergillus nidulans FGSC A4] [Rhizoctonia solani]
MHQSFLTCPMPQVGSNSSLGSKEERLQITSDHPPQAPQPYLGSFGNRQHVVSPMSNASNAGCVTCKERNKKCDLTRGPNGCRRCTQAGIECGGYPATNSRMPKPKHSDRTKNLTRQVRHPEQIELYQSLLPICLPVPNDPSLSAGTSSATAIIEDWGPNFDSLGLNSHLLAPHQSTDPYSCVISPHGQLPNTTVEQSPNLAVQLLTPPAEGNVNTRTSRARPRESMTPGQASLLNSIFSLADNPPALPYTPKSPPFSTVHGPSTGSEQVLGLGQGQNFDPYPQVESVTDLPTNLEDDVDKDDPENVLAGVLPELALDREVESNIIPFVAHAFTSWLNRFIFEPGRASSLARATIIRGHSFGQEALQQMILVAKTVLAVSKSTDYELQFYAEMYQQMMGRVLEARTCNALTREAAMKAMGSCHEFISITSKVGSLANVLNLMDIYAPVFRRACPESSGLVNLPQRLIAPTAEVSLKYFASYDVIQSVITHRPMFFRYDLDITSPQDDVLLDADDKPGLKWAIGVPDRLVIALARINILLEDYGACVDQKVTQQLRNEITKACKPVVSSSPEDDPTLVVGRLMVQESWRLVGYVYLYMGLCGADSKDARVVKVQKQFMRLLESVKSRRNPDVFLIIPMVILGIATSSPADRSILLTRLWSVSECRRSGTMANDVARMLNDIWERTKERPAVWSDLRIACLRVFHRNIWLLGLTPLVSVRFPIFVSLVWSSTMFWSRINLLSSLYMSYSSRGYQGGRRGRGGFQHRTKSAPSAKLQEGLLDEIESISVPTVSLSIIDKVEATNVVPLGSYNWIDHSTPTIIIPGTPPSWKQPRLPLRLSPDVGNTFIDQNSARLPMNPLEPLLRAINVTQNQLGNDFKLANEDIDIVTDRNGLRKLMKFITFHGPNRDPRPGRNSEFRIDAQLAPNGRTLVLTRHEEEFIDTSTKFKGYGHNFEKATTEFATPLVTKSNRTHEPQLKPTGYHRITRYDLLGLRFLVRYEVDAMDTTQKSDLDDLVASFSQSSISNSNPKPESARLENIIHVPQSELRHIVHGSLVPQNQVIELKAVFKVAWSDVYPQLFLSRTPMLKVGKHSDGYISTIQTYTSESNEMKNAHDQLIPDFVALVELLKRVRDVTKKRNLVGHDRPFALYWSGNGDLKVRTVRYDHAKNLLSAEELASF